MYAVAVDLNKLVPQHLRTVRFGRRFEGAQAGPVENLSGCGNFLGGRLPDLRLCFRARANGLGEDAYAEAAQRSAARTERESGERGPILREFRHDEAGATAALKKTQNGDAIGARRGGAAPQVIAATRRRLLFLIDPAILSFRVRAQAPFPRWLRVQ